MIRVLMVCMGNICRSPMAEAVFRQLVHEAKLDGQIEVDSAGTASYHQGERAHSGTLKVLTKHGMAYEGRSRPINQEDLTRFDYVVAMDYDNMQGIRSLGADGANISLLLDYVPEQPIREVPDPYYNGAFEQVYELVLAGSKALLEKIRSEHGI